MKLAEKIKHLREIEGERRGFGRAMTQMEVVKAMQEELGESVSQGYISQLEHEKRLRLTPLTRTLFSCFFKVDPNYLASDPEDDETGLFPDIESSTDRLKAWLIASMVEWRSDTALYDLLEGLSQCQEPHRYLECFRNFVQMPIEDLEAMLEALSDDAINFADA